jgi:predicted AlkP superfamily phosphohydrolase/phosphomutase
MEPLKTLVIGLDGATLELLLEDERLVNLRRLMEAGCYGPLQSVIPASSVPAWACLATGLDPGSLGVYGFRNRRDRSYSGAKIVDSLSMTEVAAWNDLARQAGKSVIIGDPPGCAVPPSGGVDRMSLRDEIVALARTHFAELRHVLEHQEWLSIQFIETGLDRLQRAFWRDHDPAHLLHDQGSAHRDVIRDYYRLLDDELGGLLERLADDTVVLVVSTHGAQRCDGGFCINEWLIREGLLTLHRQPGEVTSIDRLDIDWSKTRAWSEGGDCASLFFNVCGREPEGTIDPSEYDSFRADLEARLEATTDPQGRVLGTLVFQPQQIYRSVRSIPPDLIVQFGGLSWRAIDSVGDSMLHRGPGEIGEGDCCPAPQGAFVLAVPGLSGTGLVEGASVLDIAPTLMELGGREPLPGLQGRSLLNRPRADSSPGSADVDADEILVRERLSGLGYLG